MPKIQIVVRNLINAEVDAPYPASRRLEPFAVTEPLTVEINDLSGFTEFGKLVARGVLGYERASSSQAQSPVVPEPIRPPAAVRAMVGGATVGVRPNLNFSGSGVAVTDDPTNDRLNIVIAGGGGGGGGGGEAPPSYWSAGGNDIQNTNSGSVKVVRNLTVSGANVDPRNGGIYSGLWLNNHAQLFSSTDTNWETVELNCNMWQFRSSPTSSDWNCGPIDESRSSIGFFLGTGPYGPDGFGIYHYNPGENYLLAYHEVLVWTNGNSMEFKPRLGVNPQKPAFYFCPEYPYTSNLDATPYAIWRNQRGFGGPNDDLMVLNAAGTLTLKKNLSLEGSVNLTNAEFNTIAASGSLTINAFGELTFNAGSGYINVPTLRFSDGSELSSANGLGGGGGEFDTSNLMALDTAQTVTGQKTFTQALRSHGLTLTSGGVLTFADGTTQSTASTGGGGGGGGSDFSGSQRPMIGPFVSVAPTNATPGTDSLRFSNTIVHNGFLYMVCGQHGSNTNNVIRYAPVDEESGDIFGPWVNTNAPATIPGRISQEYVDLGVWNNRLYVIGFTTFNGHVVPGVHYATINADGSLGTFTTAFMGGILPPVAPDSEYMFGRGILHNGWIYYIGGWENLSNGHSYSRPHVFASQIQPDGSLTPWMLRSTMPEGRSRGAVFVHNNYLYVVGGENWNDNPQFPNTSFYAPLNPDGSIGQWSEPVTLPGGGNVPGPCWDWTKTDIVGEWAIFSGHTSPLVYDEHWWWGTRFNDDGSLTGLVRCTIEGIVQPMEEATPAVVGRTFYLLEGITAGFGSNVDTNAVQAGPIRIIETLTPNEPLEVGLSGVFFADGSRQVTAYTGLPANALVTDQDQTVSSIKTFESVLNANGGIEFQNGSRVESAIGDSGQYITSIVPISTTKNVGASGAGTLCGHAAFNPNDYTIFNMQQYIRFEAILDGDADTSGYAVLEVLNEGWGEVDRIDYNGAAGILHLTRNVTGSIVNNYGWNCLYRVRLVKSSGAGELRMWQTYLKVQNGFPWSGGSNGGGGGWS